MARNFMQTLCPRCGQHRNGRHLTDGCKVTDKMIEALLIFKKANGPRWKSKLTAAWMGSAPIGSDDVQEYLLRECRNIIGPDRLYKLKVV